MEPKKLEAACDGISTMICGNRFCVWIDPSKTCPCRTCIVRACCTAECLVFVNWTYGKKLSKC